MKRGKLPKVKFFEASEESKDVDFNKLIADSDSMETPPAPWVKNIHRDKRRKY